MTPQADIMVAAPLDLARRSELEKLLKTMNRPDVPGMADPNNALVPFEQFGKFHFARFVIIDDKTVGDLAHWGVGPIPDYPIYLAFVANWDGSTDSSSDRACRPCRRIERAARDFLVLSGSPQQRRPADLDETAFASRDRALCQLDRPHGGAGAQGGRPARRLAGGAGEIRSVASRRRATTCASCAIIWSSSCTRIRSCCPSQSLLPSDGGCATGCTSPSSRCCSSFRGCSRSTI